MEVIKKYRGLFLFEGIIFIILGALAVAMPRLSTLSMELLLGWLFVIGGVIQGVRTFQLRKAGEIVWSIISALLYLAAGIILLAYPLTGILTLTLILGVLFLVEGISKILLSFEMRTFGNWGWLMLSGILSIVIAAIIWSGWPGTATWLIGLLVGINLLFLGFTLVFLALGTIPDKTS